MVRNTQETNQNQRLSYSEYKKTVKRKPNKDMLVFISVFIISVLMILGLAKILSPNVDVGIANEEEFFQDDEDNSFSQSAIDKRLKSLKMEDEGKSEGDEKIFSPELDEKVVLPSGLRKTAGQLEEEMQNTNNQQQKAAEPETGYFMPVEKAPKHIQNEVNQPSAPVAPPPSQVQTSAKVVVGYYATDKQAEVAKTIIQDAGLNVNPIIKNMGSYYTLQVGSYSSKEKAQQAANSLLKNNFPARVVAE